MLDKWTSILMFGIGTIFGLNAIGVLVGMPIPPALSFCALILSSFVMLSEGLKEARKERETSSETKTEKTETEESKAGETGKLGVEELVTNPEKDVEKISGENIQKKPLYRLARNTGAKTFKGVLKNTVKSK